MIQFTHFKNAILPFLFFVLIAGKTTAQTYDPTTGLYLNSAQKLLQSDGNLTIGGYGEIHYNQPFSGDVRKNGTMDVHRMVMLLGYRFDERTQFVSELEFEHVNEVYVEQAFLQYKVNPYINFRGGLMLIPMGMVNEYHEPVAFNGVERPLIDNVVAPSTWREIGAGFTGLIPSLSLKYQAYVVNGFRSYNGASSIGGKSGLRNGRQKGIESFVSSPNFTTKVEYFGIKNLQLGLSLYVGNTQSTLYNGIDKNNVAANAKADSSVVGIAMIGADAQYTLGALQLKGQFYYNALSNTDEFNKFTAKSGKPNDMGSAMLGWYAEAGYNVLKHFPGTTKQLIPFIRVENYNLHHKVGSLISKNKAYDNLAYTTGVGLKLTRNAVLKADVQMVKSQADSKFSNTFNTGLGVMF